MVLFTIGLIFANMPTNFSRKQHKYFCKLIILNIIKFCTKQVRAIYKLLELFTNIAKFHYLSVTSISDKQ